MTTAHEEFYFIADSSESEWDPDEGMLKIALSPQIYLQDFDNVQWFISLIDYQPPLVNAPTFAYLIGDFISTKFVNSKLEPVIAPIRLVSTELQRARLGTAITNPVPCPISRNPLDKLTFTIRSLPKLPPFAFAKGTFFFLFKVHFSKK